MIDDPYAISAVIARCTRDGVTSWQNVAAQLGCSVDQARKKYDPQYMDIRPWPHVCEEVSPEGEPIDENDTHSLAPKTPGLRFLILCALKRHGSLSVEALAGRLSSTPNSIRMRLSQMRKDGWVENDSFGRPNGLTEWTWRLTVEGMRVAAVPTTECDKTEKEVA